MYYPVCPTVAEIMFLSMSNNNKTWMWRRLLKTIKMIVFPAMQYLTLWCNQWAPKWPCSHEEQRRKQGLQYMKPH
jgi:hypothetical protein